MFVIAACDASHVKVKAYDLFRALPKNVPQYASFA